MRDSGRRDSETTDGHGGSRALVVVAGGSQGRRETSGSDEARPAFPRYRADAAFLAHLLAVRSQVPAQRAKRRAAPEVGAAAYETGLGLLANAPRRTLGIKA